MREFQTRANAGRRHGFTYVELLASVLIVAMSAAYAMASWGISSRAPANQRVTEMGVFVATQQLERLKAEKYMTLMDTPAGTPTITYYDRYGAPAAAAAPQGYLVKTTIGPLVNRDGMINTEDLREIVVEVWDNAQTKRYEQARTLLAFGGL